MRRLLLAGLSVLVLTGCGGDESPEPERAGAAVDGVVELVGNDLLEFVPTEVTADTGDLEIVLTCAGAAPHTFALERDDEIVAECAGDGDTGRGQLSLEPGEHAFYCTIPGHRSAGMVGTLTVTDGA